VVGDDDQSIYAWRGAKPENMALLKEDFPKLKIVMLEQNYCSTTRILTSANAVITNNEHLFEKKLWSDKGQGEKIRIINCRMTMMNLSAWQKRLSPINCVLVMSGSNMPFFIAVTSRRACLRRNYANCKCRINYRAVSRF